MVYLNNAATSYPKPVCVRETLVRTIDAPPSGQFRSAGISDAGDIMGECRKRLGMLLGIGDTERIHFSSGSTEALNILFGGLDIPPEQIITTVTEHNSVLRPLFNMKGGAPMLLPCDAEGFVSPALLEEEARKGKAKAVVLNHCSNVTGVVQDAAEFGRIARKYELLFILDVSQSAGCIPICADEWGVSALAFTGHKSLMGVQGTGGFFVREGVPFRPVMFGGTGRDSRVIVYGSEHNGREAAHVSSGAEADSHLYVVGYGAEAKGLSPEHVSADAGSDANPYEFEVGTQNMPGIAALSEACGFLLAKGIKQIEAEEKALTEYCVSRLKEIEGVQLIGWGNKSHGPVVSFRSNVLLPADFAYVLQNSFDIVTRAGLHCAPLIHEYIGSGEDGTVRVSFSLFNTREDIDALVEALKELA